VGLFKESVLKTMKPVIFQFITCQGIKSNDFQLQIQSDLDKLFYNLLQQEKNNQQIFDGDLLSKNQQKLVIIEIINNVRKTIAPLKSTNENKAQIVQALKIICFINKELSQFNEKAKVLIGTEECNLNIFKLLFKDMMKQDVDTSSKLLIAAKLDREIQLIGKQLVTKFQTNKQF